jgi:DNA primase
LLAFFLRQLSEGLDTTSPEGRVAVIHRARPLLAKVADPLLRELYHERLGQYLNLPLHGVLATEGESVPEPLTLSPTRISRPAGRWAEAPVGRDFERLLLAMLLSSPALLATWEEELGCLELENPQLAALLSELLTLGTTLVDGSATPLWQRLPTAALVAQAEAILVTEETQLESLHEEFAGCLANCQLRHLNRQINQKTQAMQAGSGDADPQQLGMVFALKQEKQRLQQRKSHLVTR